MGRIRMAYYGRDADHKNLAEARRELAELEKRHRKLAKQHSAAVERLAELEAADRRRNSAARELEAVMADPAELSWYRESAWLKAGAEEGQIPDGWPEAIASVEGGIRAFVAEQRGLVEVRLVLASDADQYAPRPRATFLAAERERVAAAQAPVERARKESK